MKNLAAVFILLTSFSCRSYRTSQQQDVMASWQGKKVSELNAHPYFSSLRIKTSEVTRVYEEPGIYHTKAVCALGLLHKFDYIMKKSCLTNIAKEWRPI